MPSRELPYPVFDADNHFYEPKEALTQFLPENRKGVIDYIDINGRTKIVVRKRITDYIPNPTFEVVARPGAQEEYFRSGAHGKSYREVMGKPIKSIPAFRNPEARLEVMDGLALDYTIMFPTLASLVEERMKDDPELILDMIHALNQWMYETWQFDYEGRIFSTPVINLSIVDRALEELEWCLERGAKTVLVRPAPVPGFRGTRSMGLPEFDPFWEACVKAGIPVCMHASDSGYAQYLDDWEPAESICRSSRPPSGWSRWASAPSRTPWRRWSATARCTATRICASCLSRTARPGCPTCCTSSPMSTRSCRPSSRRIRSRTSSAGCTSPRSGRTTSRRWPT